MIIVYKTSEDQFIPKEITVNVYVTLKILPQLENLQTSTSDSRFS